MERISGKLFKDMLASGMNNLTNHSAEVDSLNVFPVPDGDTGTNMSLTFSSGVNDAIKVEEDHVGKVAKVLSRGLLMGARGNSGVITSQIFRGFFQSVEHLEDMDALQLAQALVNGSRVAYRAVMRPVEGTILTVVREAADYTYAYTVTEEANDYYIHIKNPKEVYDKVLVLDAGHGGMDPGTNGNGLKEKDLNLSILQKAYEKLQQTDKVKVYVTRIDDTYPENTARAEMANDIADVFLSIHMNSASPNPTPNGTEALFITHETDVAGKLTSQTVATVVLKNVVNALAAVLIVICRVGSLEKNARLRSNVYYVICRVGSLEIKRLMVAI